MRTCGVQQDGVEKEVWNTNPLGRLLGLAVQQPPSATPGADDVAIDRARVEMAVEGTCTKPTVCVGCWRVIACAPPYPCAKRSHVHGSQSAIARIRSARRKLRIPPHRSY